MPLSRHFLMFTLSEKVFGIKKDIDLAASNQEIGLDVPRRESTSPMVLN